MKKWLVLLLTFALMTILIACGSTSNGGSSNKVEPPINVSEDEIASGNLEIVASNWEFDQEYYAIRAGEEVSFTVNSVEGVHGIEIVGTPYSSIVKDATAVTITEPGTYVIRCSVPCGGGHRTMTSKLVVVG